MNWLRSFRQQDLFIQAIMIYWIVVVISLVAMAFYVDYGTTVPLCETNCHTPDTNVDWWVFML